MTARHPRSGAPACRLVKTMPPPCDLGSSYMHPWLPVEPPTRRSAPARSGRVFAWLSLTCAAVTILTVLALPWLLLSVLVRWAL